MTTCRTAAGGDGATACAFDVRADDAGQHRAGPWSAAVGFLLLLAGALLLVPLPEAAVPALAAGLRLLGQRYVWARRANTWMVARTHRIGVWWHAQPSWRRRTLTATAAAALLGSICAGLQSLVG